MVVTLLDLSDELLLTIFSYVDVFSLFSCRQTCCRLNRVGRDVSLGRTLVVPPLTGDRSASLLNQMVQLFGSRLLRLEIRSCQGITLEVFTPLLRLLSSLRSLTILSRVIESTRSLTRLMRNSPNTLESLQVGTISGFVRHEDLLLLGDPAWTLTRLSKLDLSVHVVQSLHNILYNIRSPLKEIIVRTTVSHSAYETRELIRQWSIVCNRVPPPTHVRFWIDSPNNNCRVGYVSNESNSLLLHNTNTPWPTTAQTAEVNSFFRMLHGVNASFLTSLLLENVSFSNTELRLLIACEPPCLRYLTVAPASAIESPWDEHLVRWLDSTLQRSNHLSRLRVNNIVGVDQLALPYRASSSHLWVLDLGIDEGITPNLWSLFGNFGDSSTATTNTVEDPGIYSISPLQLDLSEIQFSLTNLRWLCLRTNRHALQTLALSLGSQLLSLQVVLSDAITDADLSMIVRTWPRLEQLALFCTNPAKVSDDGVASLGGLTNLRVLRLHHMALIRTGEGFVRMSSKCQKLEELSLAYTGAVGDSSILINLPTAIAAWSSLQTLRLIQPRYIVRESLYQALSSLRSLVHVSLTGSGMEHFVQNSVSFFTNKSTLQYLRVGMLEQVRRVELRYESPLWTQARHTPAEVFECWSRMDYNLFYQLAML